MSEILDEKGMGSFNLNGKAVGYLSTIAKWAFFLSIVGFVMVAVILCMAIFINQIFQSGIMRSAQGVSETASIFQIIYLFTALLTFFPAYFLMRFSVTAKKGIKSGDELETEKALGYLKSHYKFIGIVTAVVVAIYLFVFLIMGLSAL